MEKCTYCVQRINQARIDAKIEDRAVGGDEVVDRLPGGLPDAGDRLRQPERPRERGRAGSRQSPRNYALLAELNTRPRTTYLARLRNPNPEIEPTDERPRRNHAMATATWH